MIPLSHLPSPTFTLYLLKEEEKKRERCQSTTPGSVELPWCWGLNPGPCTQKTCDLLAVSPPSSGDHVSSLHSPWEGKDTAEERGTWLADLLSVWLPHPCVPQVTPVDWRSGCPRVTQPRWGAAGCRGGMRASLYYGSDSPKARPRPPRILSPRPAGTWMWGTGAVRAVTHHEELAEGDVGEDIVCLVLPADLL